MDIYYMPADECISKESLWISVERGEFILGDLLVADTKLETSQQRAVLQRFQHFLDTTDWELHHWFSCHIWIFQTVLSESLKLWTSNQSKIFILTFFSAEKSSICNEILIH